MSPLPVEEARRPESFEVFVKGLRIPYVAAWEAETADVAWCPFVDAYAASCGGFDHADAARAGRLGAPILGKMAPQRQRRCMVLNLCQVCARPMTERVVLGNVEPRGPDRLVCLDEPPCCPSCALVAVKQCPFARKAWEFRGGALLFDADLRAQAVYIDPHDPQFPRAARRRHAGKPVVMHVRMVPTRMVVIQGDEALEALRAMRNPGRIMNEIIPAGSKSPSLKGDAQAFSSERRGWRPTPGGAE